jgi:hypothetical protein
MTTEDDFELWLGACAVRAVGSRPQISRTRAPQGCQSGGRCAAVLALAADKAFRRQPDRPRRRASAGCSAIAAIGYAASRARRVIVKARIVKLAGKGAARRQPSHLRYLQRDGTTREGGRGHALRRRQAIRSTARRSSNAAPATATSSASSSRPRTAPNMTTSSPRDTAADGAHRRGSRHEARLGGGRSFQHRPSAHGHILRARDMTIAART